MSTKTSTGSTLYRYSTYILYLEEVPLVRNQSIMHVWYIKIHKFVLLITTDLSSFTIICLITVRIKFKQVPCTHLGDLPVYGKAHTGVLVSSSTIVPGQASWCHLICFGFVNWLLTCKHESFCSEFASVYS